MYCLSQNYCWLTSPKHFCTSRPLLAQSKLIPKTFRACNPRVCNFKTLMSHELQSKTTPAQCDIAFVSNAVLILCVALRASWGKSLSKQQKDSACTVVWRRVKWICLIGITIVTDIISKFILPAYPSTWNYYENNSLRVIFRNFWWKLHP